MSSDSISNAVITINFDGEGEVSLGGGEFFVTPQGEGQTLMLDQVRLNLIDAVMAAQAEADAQATA